MASNPLTFSSWYFNNFNAVIPAYMENRQKKTLMLWYNVAQSFWRVGRDTIIGLAIGGVVDKGCLIEDLTVKVVELNNLALENKILVKEALQEEFDFLVTNSNQLI